MTLSTSYFRQFWQHEGTVFKGVWSWFVDALQTNYSSVRGEGAGVWENLTSHANFDEYKWKDIFLVSGTYKITFVHSQGPAHGIAEFLFDGTSLGTIDAYNNLVTYNLVDTISFSISDPTTADFRFRVNGNNILSLDYYIDFSRIYVEKTV